MHIHVGSSAVQGWFREAHERLIRDGDLFLQFWRHPSRPDLADRMQALKNAGGERLLPRALELRAFQLMLAPKHRVVMLQVIEPSFW